MHVFGVHGFGARREPDEVAEERRYHFALLLETLALGCGDRRTARSAEPEPVRVLTAAALAAHLRAITAPISVVNQIA